jgi:hypothetical protein
MEKEKDHIKKSTKALQEAIKAYFQKSEKLADF